MEDNGPGVTKIVSLRACRDREKLRETFFKAAGIFAEIRNRNRLNTSTQGCWKCLIPTRKETSYSD